MVGRSVQVNSLCFTKADRQQNLANGAKANLLVFNRGLKRMVTRVLRHILRMAKSKTSIKVTRLVYAMTGM